MITSQGIIEYLRHHVPLFDERWQQHVRYWAGEKPGLCNDIEVLTSHTVKLVRLNSIAELRKIGEVVEHLFMDGDDDVRNLMATCFLESLINIFSHEAGMEERLVPFLGAATKQEWMVLSS